MNSIKYKCDKKNIKRVIKWKFFHYQGFISLLEILKYFQYGYETDKYPLGKPVRSHFYYSIVVKIEKLKLKGLLNAVEIPRILNDKTIIDKFMIIHK